MKVSARTLNALISTQLKGQPKSVEELADYYSLTFKQLITGQVESTRSPIEAMFCISWNYQTVLFEEHFRRWLGANFLDLASQEKVEVDNQTFYIDFVARVMDYNEVGDVVSKASVFVELDGHDFHEKTKEQVEKDKIRERQISKFTDRVLRFSGREVYRNPDNCVREVIDALQDIYNKKVNGN
ncbi:DUF559 domain-containing protein [Lacticaseibacillus rhamnosus]|uniref:DUF559 domain-containing protein n=1 Tax=Lacticaseibacillus rhamnosus TaxID=47715 RepID=UPI000629F937|nr:DUF559 domain-containing protein [Lacticaseibacillus rhamnosus]KKW88326.1 hypothetical protein XA20_04635 [Lacticaseibacillus rhamnosus]MCZ2733624.1 DUF559 domain-containing protein [Lacticaseibacillus rhamnosus]MCZ2736307.1 DUF559 domain-containing protein [Lacticaseibacillus rhamnosus]MCZ2742619.1 DUF559 domain-containing protein [Lacticaseibacillus rhamnosus]MCZ2745363.1 DUF559 domain-containing protein [Lacticaseibacillus rhamnosus]